MKKLTNIVRVRISDDTKEVLKGRNLSKYIREALREKIEREFGQVKCPF